MTHWLAVAVATPAHSGLDELLTYRHDAPLAPGSVVRVPLGRREMLGLVWGPAEPPAAELVPQVRPVGSCFDGLAPLPTDWRELIAFVARYYQRTLGEVALAALPPQLRTLDATQMARRLKRHPPAAAPLAPATGHAALSAEQAADLSYDITLEQTARTSEWQARGAGEFMVPDGPLATLALYDRGAGAT